MVEDKCKDCFAYQYDEEFGDICISPVCIKEYDYDPETRTWILIKKTNKKESMNTIMIMISLFVLFMILMKFL